MTTPYAPMLSKDGTCLLMPNGSFERLDRLPRYDPTQQSAPAPAAATAVPAKAAAPAVTDKNQSQAKE